MNLEESVDFILTHFTNQLQLFPRKMMTAKSNSQFPVTSKKEIMDKSEESDFIDCRINAYPEFVDYKGIIRHPPDFIFIDLDLPAFDNNKSKIDRSLKRILDNIDKLNSVKPTVLWSGNGYHIYLPLEALVLDQVDIFSKVNFPSLFEDRYYSKYKKYSVSELFLKFAELYLTNGKSDQMHSPKYKTCLIRIPNTYNSKCIRKGLNPEQSKIKIIQKWDGKRLPIQLLLKDFRRWIVQEEINQKKGIEKSKSKKKSFNRSNNYNNNNTSIKWIERLLQTPIADYRKHVISLILSPYLMLVKKLSYQESYHIMTDWLLQCDLTRKLDFDHNYLVKLSLNTVLSKGILPMNLATLKNRNIELYHRITNLK